MEHEIQFKNIKESTDDKGRKRKIYSYEIVRKGVTVGTIYTTDKEFIEYLYGLGCNVVSAKEITPAKD